MSAQDRLNSKVQYYTLLLLIVIARRLLYGNGVSNEQDRKDLFDLQHAEDFVKDVFNGGSE